MYILIIYAAGAVGSAFLAFKLVLRMIAITPAGGQVMVRLGPWTSVTYSAPEQLSLSRSRPVQLQTMTESLQNRKYSEWFKATYPKAIQQLMEDRSSSPDDEDLLIDAFVSMLEKWDNNYERKDDAVLWAILKSAVQRRRITKFRKRMNMLDAERRWARENYLEKLGENNHLASLLNGVLDDVIDTLSKTSAAQARILEMRIKEGFSCPEIATQLDMNLNTVKSHHERAVATLRAEVTYRSRSDPELAALLGSRLPRTDTRGRHRSKRESEAFRVERTYGEADE